jgi:hypothetical protein
METKFKYELNKDCWNEILDFLDINSLLNIELINKKFEEQIMYYYLTKEKNYSQNDNNDKQLVTNYKQKFISKYFNYIVEYSLNDLEFFNDDEENKVENLLNKKVYKKIGQIFSRNLQYDILKVYKNKIFVLYKNNDFKYLEFNKDDENDYKISLINKINFDNHNILDFIYIPTLNLLFFVNKLNEFYYIILHNFQIIKYKYNIKFNDQIEKIYLIKNYIIFLDNKDIFHYLQKENIFNILNESNNINNIEDSNDNYNNINNDKDIIEENKNNINSIENENEENEKEENKKDLILIPESFPKKYTKITKISQSENNLMFCDDSNILYYISIKQINPKVNEIQLQQVGLDKIKFNNIFSLNSSDNFWFLLEKKVMPPLIEWKNSDIYKWFENLRLYDYLNIIKYEKITGKDILNGDKDFFVKCIGMEEDEIKKLMYEITKVKIGSNRQCQLFGWGNNKNGQLGLMNLNVNYCKFPTKINLPNLNENDSVEKIFTGNSYTILLSKMGKVFITGKYSIKEKMNKFNNDNNSNNNNNQNHNQNKVENKKNKKNKKEKNKKNDIKENEEKKTLKNRWIDITKNICYNEENKTFLKIKNIYCYDNNIIFFGFISTIIPFNAIIKKPKFKHLKKGTKFITSDKIIDNILEFQKKEINNYHIVYGDSLLKMLEATLPEFLESEVPYHKIEQIKLFNEIIWDRKKRFLKENFISDNINKELYPE